MCILKIRLVVILVICSLLFCSFSLNRNEKLKTVEFKDLHISLYCSKDWKQATDQMDEYTYDFQNMLVGKDGFLEADYIEVDSTINDIIHTDLNPDLQFFGKKPVVLKLKVGGQDAWLIFPSNDQNAVFKNRALLYVKYPSSIAIPAFPELPYQDPDKKYFYNYLYLFADKSHILQISRTIKFVP